MFEKYNVPAIFISKDAVLSCYACGRTSGLVVDIGGSGTCIAPVNDGWVEAKGIQRSLIGGRLLDAHILHLLSQQGITTKPNYKLVKTIENNDINNVVIKVQDKVLSPLIHPTYHALMNLELGRDIKENIGRIADNSIIDNDQRFFNIPLTQYTLPDGTIIDCGIDRYNLTEILYDSSTVNINLYNDLNVLNLLPNSNNISYALPSTNINTNSITKLIVDSILKCESDTQNTLISNVIVTGGGATFEGTPERYRTELEKIIYPNIPSWKVKVMSPGSGERAISAWLGGSILASLGSFHEMWMARSEYDEFGASLVDRKCP